MRKTEDQHGTQLFRQLAAVVLLIAAIAKSYTYRGSQIDQVAVAALELTLAVWLLSGLGRTASSVVASIVFACFAAGAAARLSLGISSCRCLGNLRVHPAVMLLLCASLSLGLAGAWKTLPQMVARSTKVCCLVGLTVAVIMAASQVLALHMTVGSSENWARELRGKLGALPQQHSHLHVVVVNSHCPHCRSFLLDLRAGLKHAVQPGVLLIAETEPFSTSDERRTFFPPEVPVISIDAWSPPCLPAELWFEFGRLVRFECPET